MYRFIGSITSGQYCNPTKHSEGPDSQNGELLAIGTGDINRSAVSFTIFPNPTNGKFSCEIHSESAVPDITLRVYGLLGNLVMKEEMVHTRKMEVNLEDKPAGLYVITARIGDQIGSARIIKQ